MTTIKQSKFGLECVDEEHGVGAYTYVRRVFNYGKQIHGMPVWIFFWDKPNYREEVFGLN
jgi:hypothetical protein